jgi:hypothetical protein
MTEPGEDPIVETPEEASQGERQKGMPTVLLVSMGLGAALLILAAIIVTMAS